LTLGCANAYGRDWLEARLESTIRRILMGVLGRDVNVQFEVVSFRPQTTSDPEPEEEPVSEPKAAPEDARVTLIRSSLEEALLQPEKVVTVPGYFLRWLPYLGFERAWLVVALRQAFYQTYGHPATAKTPFEASGAQLARWSGITRQTIQKYLKTLKNDPLGWFVTYQAEGDTGQAASYQFRMVMPLTPGDTVRLQDWLLIHGGQTDPITAVKQALDTQPKNILPYPAPAISPELRASKANPKTVGQIVLETCGLRTGDPRLPELKELARKLEARLMPLKDVLVVSHYFLLSWLPELGAGPAWMLTLLRDQCYHNHHTGELRDELHLTEGYQELAQALGLDRPKTIGDWLPPLDEMARRARFAAEEEVSEAWQKRQPVRERVGMFIEKGEVDFRSGPTGKIAQWTLKVSLADPLLPEHARGLEWLTLFSQLEDPAWLDQLATAQDADEFEARSLQGLRRESYRLNESEARSLQVRGAKFTGSSESEARSLQGLRRDFYTLKHLIKHLNLKHLIKHLPPLPPSEPEPDVGPPQRGAGEVTLPDEWEFDKLLEMGGIAGDKAQKTLRRIENNPEIGTRFLGWMLYGYVHKATPGEEKGIRTPLIFANSRAEAVPDPDYLALAKYTPRALVTVQTRRQRYQTVPITHTQSQILDALDHNGFFDLLTGMAGTNSPTT
ncbi:MAG TPA: hypothetical protein PK530_21135, partial [Anaerolineales bacterium]|nr:hypothetical protein [Anaerolineales bacterium]